MRVAFEEEGRLVQTGMGRYTMSAEAYEHLGRRNDPIYTPRHAENEANG